MNPEALQRILQQIAQRGLISYAPQARPAVGAFARRLPGIMALNFGIEGVNGLTEGMVPDEKYAGLNIADNPASWLQENLFGIQTPQQRSREAQARMASTPSTPGGVPVASAAPAGTHQMPDGTMMSNAAMPGPGGQSSMFSVHQTGSDSLTPRTPPMGGGAPTPPPGGPVQQGPYQNFNADAALAERRAGKFDMQPNESIYDWRKRVEPVAGSPDGFGYNSATNPLADSPAARTYQTQYGYDKPLVAMARSAVSGGPMYSALEAQGPSTMDAQTLVALSGLLDRGAANDFSGMNDTQQEAVRRLLSDPQGQAALLNAYLKHSTGGFGAAYTSKAIGDAASEQYNDPYGPTTQAAAGPFLSRMLRQRGMTR